MEYMDKLEIHSVVETITKYILASETQLPNNEHDIEDAVKFLLLHQAVVNTMQPFPRRSTEKSTLRNKIFNNRTLISTLLITTILFICILVIFIYVWSKNSQGDLINKKGHTVDIIVKTQSQFGQKLQGCSHHKTIHLRFMLEQQTEWSNEFAPPCPDSVTRVSFEENIIADNIQYILNHYQAVREVFISGKSKHDSNTIEPYNKISLGTVHKLSIRRRGCKSLYNSFLTRFRFSNATEILLQGITVDTHKAKKLQSFLSEATPVKQLEVDAVSDSPILVMQ